MRCLYYEYGCQLVKKVYHTMITRAQYEVLETASSIMEGIVHLILYCKIRYIAFRTNSHGHIIANIYVAISFTIRLALQ